MARGVVWSAHMGDVCKVLGGSSIERLEMLRLYLYSSPLMHRL
jgi:hypothetical protein